MTLLSVGRQLNALGAEPECNKTRNTCLYVPYTGILRLPAPDDAPMDLLADLLLHAGLRQRLLSIDPWRAEERRRFPCDRSFGFHLVLAGEIEVSGPSLPDPIRLHAGDIGFMTRGCHHTLAAPDVADTEPRILSAAYQLWHDPVHPLFEELPEWRVLRAGAGQTTTVLADISRLLLEEAHTDRLGSSAIVSGLMDVAFTYLLRGLVEGQGGDPLSWGLAARNPPVRRALEAMHSSLAHDWTLDRLAEVAGMSRTVFASRFRTTLGETPVGYLRRLRVQRAMGLLSATDAPLASIATRVGYQDAFGFSKVFKRVTGSSPRDFRRRASGPDAPLQARPLSGFASRG